VKYFVKHFIKYFTTKTFMKVLQHYCTTQLVVQAQSSAFNTRCISNTIMKSEFDRTRITAWSALYRY